jgi:hypothetical protein
MPKEPDLLGTSGKPLFFRADVAAGLRPPAIRPGRGEAVRAVVRSLSAMQKEALVASARTGAVWRLASDEGAYLDGHDVAPCPLSFFTTGMICSYMNEILALASQRHIALRQLKLIQDNYYTMKGSALAGTMTGGARDVELEAIIDTDASPSDVQALVCDAIAASPIQGLLRGVKDSLFTGHDTSTGRPSPIAKIYSTPRFRPPATGRAWCAAVVRRRIMRTRRRWPAAVSPNSRTGCCTYMPPARSVTTG